MFSALARASGGGGEAEATNAEKVALQGAERKQQRGISLE